MFRDKKRYGQEASIVIKSKPPTFNKPLHWKGPAKVFVCSWSDFFIEEADKWRKDAYDIMFKTPHLTYLLLTKRPENIDTRWIYLDNMWMGVTVESDHYKWRVISLRETKAKIKFISMEPLIGPVYDLPLISIDWVIVGAESGPDRRPCKIEWARAIVQQCKEAGVPVFVKQLHINGKVSSDINEWPKDLRVQDFPKEKAG
jgi:protein gp37